MEFVYSKIPSENAATKIAKELTDHLKKGERVLLLLSGGSNIKTAAMISDKLRGAVDASNLYVTLMDERYGPISHKDENWQQLLDAGFVLPGANLYRPLIGQNLTNTTAAFSDWIQTQLSKADYKIGLFGLGTDGHTAGIKPGSPAVNSEKLVVSYIGEDFTRVTISFVAILALDTAIIQVSGSDKQFVISELINQGIPLERQPAQILKRLPKAIIYSNSLEEGK